MLAQQMHGYNSEEHEIAVKSALLACTGENGSRRCLVCGKELPPLS